jgi:uncharacterized protein (TIGR02145 family)
MTKQLLILLLGIIFCSSIQGQENENVLTDERDDRTYKTGALGDQIWIMENLDYAHEKSWCYDDQESNCKAYGRLYSFEAARESCPSGYHLPNKEEWNSLIDFFGGESAAGGKMAQWGKDNFNIKFAGKKLPYGSYNYMRNYAFYWSSDSDEAGNVFILTVKAGNQNCAWNPVNKNGAYYVRCVKDMDE